MHFITYKNKWSPATTGAFFQCMDKTDDVQKYIENGEHNAK